MQPLLPGARLAVVSLASSANPERVHRGVEALQRLGYLPQLFPTALAKSPPYFAGTPADRLADLHRAFADPTIDGILCTRGGYGSNYLLEGMDLELIRSHPKPFIGYSDYTAIQTWMLDQASMPVFHGPMVAADFALESGVDLPSFQAALGGEAYILGPAAGLRPLRSGTARGILYGGCLSLLTQSLGTRFAAQTEGKLLFLEDVGAKPYQADRMLRHLMLAGKLEGVTGIVFGEMLDCSSPNTAPSLLEDAIMGVLDRFHGPIAIGLRSGHVSRANVTLPLGVEAELEVSPEATSLRIASREREV
ncbi:MAG: S66 peptidase family protein [Acidobacteriaceae bacterium]